MEEESGPHTSGNKLTPWINQEFDSEEGAFQFYNTYAKYTGFSVRRHSNRLHKTTKQLLWKRFVCAKEGKPDEYKKRKKTSTDKEERRRGTTRCKCTARLCIVPTHSGKWRVSAFISEHNHELATPNEVQYLPSHRNLRQANKDIVEHLEVSNIPMMAQVQVSDSISGGPKDVGCTTTDLEISRSDDEAKLDKHDSEMLLLYFESEKENNPSFYFEVYTDEDNRLNRCFWADVASRTAYSHFGDAVLFNTTFHTNKYHMVFASFTGVNNHDQTTVFGCGLMSNENRESLIWLLKQWLNAMPGSRPPQIIITNQNATLANVISEVLPQTVHRLGIWHIMANFEKIIPPQVLKDFYGLFKASIYDSETEEEFEETWRNALLVSNMEKDVWLGTLYGLRHQWVPAYCKNIFAYGKKSDQRAEINNTFFKGLISVKNSLLDLVTRFDLTLRRQRQKELKSDQDDVTRKSELRTRYAIEKEMMGLYTKEIFLLFQDELVESEAYLKIEFSREEGEATVYTVVKEVEGASRMRRIYFDKTSNFARCSCSLFEFEGILCRHLLFFFREMKVVKIPSQYILTRWTKGAKSVWDEESVKMQHVDDNDLMVRHIQLSQLSQHLTEESCLLVQTAEYARKGMEMLITRVKEMQKNLGVEIQEVAKENITNESIINDLHRVRNKGRGSSKRFVSTKEFAEIAMDKQLRKCKTCGLIGHDRWICPMVNEGQKTENTQADYDETNQSTSGPDAYCLGTNFQTGEVQDTSQSAVQDHEDR